MIYMLKKHIWRSVIVFFLTCSFAGCSGKSDENTDTLLEDQAAQEQEDTQSTVDLTGEWVDSNSQRCYMEITCQNDTYYEIIIDWANSASDNMHWEILAEYDESQGGFVYDDGRCVEQYYPDDGSDMQETEIYSNGKGLFYQNDGKLYWNDETEDIGKDCVFEKLSQ